MALSPSPLRRGDGLFNLRQEQRALEWTDDKPTSSRLAVARPRSLDSSVVVIEMSWERRGAIVANCGLIDPVSFHPLTSYYLLGSPNDDC